MMLHSQLKAGRLLVPAGRVGKLVLTEKGPLSSPHTAKQKASPETQPSFLHTDLGAPPGTVRHFSALYSGRSSEWKGQGERTRTGLRFFLEYIKVLLRG